MSLKQMHREQQAKNKPTSSPPPQNVEELLLLIPQLTDELEKATLTNQELTQRVQQLTAENVSLQESDEELQRAKRLNESCKQQKSELDSKAAELQSRSIEQDRRDKQLSEREQNITKTERELQEKADKRIADARERAEQRAEQRISSFRKSYIGVFIALSIACAAQLVAKAVTDTLLRERFGKLVELFRSVPSWSWQQIALTAAVATAVLVFVGYQYIKRFRDEFTLAALLLIVTVTEYAAPIIVNHGLDLWTVFVGLQAFYIIIRDTCDENSGIRRVGRW